VPSSSGSSRPRLLELHDAKNEGTLILQNVGIYAPNDTVSHPRRLDSLSTLQGNRVGMYTYNILRITKQTLGKVEI